MASGGPATLPGLARPALALHHVPHCIERDGYGTGCVPLGLSLNAFEPKRSFGGFHSTCLPVLVTDRAMETWYHSPIA